MRKTYLNTKNIFLILLLLSSILTLNAQQKNAFDVRYQNNIRGDLIFIANGIVNRNTATRPIGTAGFCDSSLSDNALPNTPYNILGNSSLYNDCLYMEYIDIDTDVTTFSSSSSSLTIPDKSCSKVRYAGLYWSASYQYNIGGDSNSGRNSDFNQVKFKVPGGNYVDITADEVIFDGFGDADFGGNSPYSCYADVTSLVTAMADPEGDYFVANVRASQGFLNSGVSGGWTMVVVFENPSYPGKYITTFDGFAGVNSTQTLDIPYNGFITLPPPFPVRAKYLIATLEGDNRITGDRLSIRANSNSTFTNFGTASATQPNFNNNFFDSNITYNHTILNNRNPNSINTLGYDTDQFDIANAFNAVIPNSETGATLRASTSGDQYFIFLNALDVEIIEPKIILYKQVEDLAGNDIGGGNVTLGQQIDYVLSFENIGNDDGANYTIRDVFPNNTIFIPGSIVLPPGVTYVYNATNHEITLSIPNQYIEAGDPLTELRIRMQIVETCADLRDACSNIIQNTAYSSYRGVLNDNQITDDPSVSDFDVCGFAAPGSTNFLIGLDECDFVRNVALCGSGVDLTAGNGYDTYQWRTSSGTVIGNTQTITVTAPGTYIVTKASNGPCLSFDETVVVSLFSSTTTHPVIPYADEVVVCPNDGDDLPKIFLCGVDDSRFIDTNINDAQSIEWQQLVQGSCPDVGIDDCANKDSTCGWTTISTSDSFDATTAGEYRIVVFYQNGCFSRFYFNVYENILDPNYITKDIICTSPGEILITNVPSSYEFQLVNQTTGVVVVDFQSSPLFTVNAPGVFTVNIRQVGVGPTACIFTLTDIGIRQRNFAINAIATNQQCNILGSIRVQALDVQPQYYYELRRGGIIVDTHGPTNSNDYTFNNLLAGIYDVTVTTDDGCTLTRQVEILNESTLAFSARVSQHITCKEGNILVNPSGGKPPYQYAIWSFNSNGTAPDLTYANVTDIPASAFQTSQIFDIPIGSQGDYIFVVVDRNNCYAFSNEVTIYLEQAVEYNIVKTDERCYQANDGTITINITDGRGYKTDFSINGGTYRNSNTFTNLAPGTYDVTVRATKGSESCEYVTQVIIDPATELFGDAEISQPYTCLSNGEIRVVPGSVSGGVPPYMYSINGVNFTTNPVFGNLVAGTYNMTIRDSNLCTITVGPLTIDPLNQPTDLTFSATAITCLASTSNVTVSVVGGTAPFTYQITAPSGSVINNGNNNIFTGLNPGSYTFLVTDSKGCTITENYTVNPIVPIQVTGQVNGNISCFGNADGDLTFNISGFVSTYSYSIVNAANVTVASGSNSSMASILLINLSDDTYTINVTDNTTSCTNALSLVIDAPIAPLDFTFTNTTIDCNNTTANLVVSANGGWGGYRYQLENNVSTVIYPYQNSPVFNGIAAGNYVVFVQDANGCVVSKPLAITPYAAPTVSLVADSVCLINSPLTLTATASGGVAPLQYSLNGGPNQTSNVFTVFSGANFTVTVTDAFGCTTDSNIVLVPNQLMANAILTKGLDCTVSPDAVVTITANGGTPNYTYEVSSNNGATFSAISTTSNTTETFTTSVAGNYLFRITDGVGCISLSNVITIDAVVNPDITSVVQTNDILCNGDSNASIQINVDYSLGVPPYTINVVNTTTSTNYGTQTSGLPAGTYEITITDANSCTDNETITINEPNPINYSIALVPITCDTSIGTIAGSITVQNLTGGTAEYTYYLTNNFGYAAQYTTTAGGENYAFTILDFGIYEVDVIDANGCSLRTTEIIASPPNDLDIDVTTATANCALGGTAIVTVSTAIGLNNYEFGILTTNTAPYASIFQMPDTPGGPTSTFTGLTPGVTYTFVVHDLTTDCFYFESALAPIDSPSNLTINLDVINNVTCTGSGDANVNFTFDNYDAGATSVSYEIFNSQNNVTTGISGSQPVSGGPVSITNLGPLAPGNYYILLSEIGGAFAGCTTGSAQFPITESTNLLAVTATVDKNDNCNVNAGQISAIGQYGTPPYEYQLTLDTDPAPDATSWAGSATSVFNLEGGNYRVYVKDANNCIQSVDINLPTDPSPEITALLTNQCTGAEGSYSVNITLNVVGVGPYYIRTDGGAPQSASGLVAIGNVITFSTLSSGPHSFEIIDANGCGEIENITIYPPLQVGAQITAQASCTVGGTITVNGIGGSGNYSYVLLDSSANPTGYVISGTNFTNIPAGSYIVEITDTTTTCTSQTPISLETPTPVIFTLNSGDVSCNGGNDGFIQVLLNPSNDNPPYTYSLFDGITTVNQSGPIFNGLSAGSYDITVTSGRNCTATQSILIGEPNALTIIASATPFACNASNSVNSSTLTITASNGTSPYSYSIDGINYFTTNTFNITDTGTNQSITATVRDANGCEMTSTPVTINTLIPINANITIDTPLSCAAGETITINASGGTGDFTFEVLPSGSFTTQTGTSATFTLPLISVYTIRITDNNTTCYIDVDHNVNAYPLMDVLASVTSNVDCFGNTTGEITVNIQNYSGNYNFNVLDDTGASVTSGSGNTASSLVIPNLNGGNYTVSVTQTDAPFCNETSNSVTIASPFSAVNTTLDITALVTCNNDGGALTATGSGGTAPYQYELVNTSTSTTIQVFGSNNVFDNLSSGNYTVTIRDANGCTATNSNSLTLPTPINATISATPTNLLCFGDTNATVTVSNVTGGQGTYQYILNYDDGTSSGAQQSNIFNNLGAGTYSVTVTDGLSCDFTTPTVTINEPTEVLASLIQTSPTTCTTDGALELSATGGTAPYQYSTDGVTYIGGFSASVIISPAAPGVYQYYVRDANGCDTTVSNEITVDPVTPLMLNIDTTNATINCTGDSTALIRAQATGGLGNYMYELLDSPSAILALQGPQASGTFNNYAAGTYYVRVVSQDCAEISGPITITDPVQLQITSQSFTNVSCIGQNDGTITVVGSGGTGLIKYSITPNLDQFDTTNTFEDLVPGTYEVIVQDELGCFISLVFDIIEPTPISANAITVLPETCAGDNNAYIEIEITGGTAPYFTSLNTQDDANFVQDQVIFSDLVGGQSYVIFVRDSGGCDTNVIVNIPTAVSLEGTIVIDNFCDNNMPSNSVTVLLNDPTVTNVTYALDNGTPQTNNVFTDLVTGDHSIEVTHIDGCSRTYDFNIQAFAPLTLVLAETNINEITAVASGGTGVYEFFLNNASRGDTNVFHITQTGTYTVRVEDSFGCYAEASIYIEFVDICIPNFFSPDGDGNNDAWAPCNTLGFPNIITKIYDRYGRVVAELEKVETWDGRYNGQELPTGDYWYVIKLNQNDDNRQFVGHFTLYR